MPAVATEVEEAEREGVEIHFLAMPVGVLSKNDKLTGIQCIRMELGKLDANGRRHPVPVKGSEFNMDIDNVIIAIGQTVDKTMLPKELEYTSWGTLSVDPVTLQTNIEGVFAGGDVVAGPADIIGAIAAGKEAAISIKRYLGEVDLKEGRSTPVKQVKEVSREGVGIKARHTMPVLEPEKRKGFVEVELGFDEKMAIKEAKRCLNCGVCSECLECVKACEPKAINFEQEDKFVEVEVGSIIVATGFNVFDPTSISQYGYQRLENVITGLEFERLVNSTGPTSGNIVLKDGSAPRSIAIIHCVGSRDKNYHAYCSRVCCMYSLKYAHLIKEKTNAEVYQMYLDMRCFGKGYEEFYDRLSEEGVNFIRGKVAEITENTTNEGEGRLIVSCEDTLFGKILKVPVDMVILSTALEMPPDAEKVAHLFNISQGADGFFLEKHPKLDPIATTTDGVFVVGCCQGPKDISDTVTQASAAAARVLAMISKGRIEIEAATVIIDEKSCSGCQICKLVCPYNAISFEEEKQVCCVSEVLCKGCGICVGGCLSNAISLNHFTNEQILAEMEGALVQ
jgi:heterodisulfide reductase subunit A